MEPGDDPKLTELLREWQVPDAPPSLDARVLVPRKNRWSFLFTGSIRVPVPVGLAIVAIVLAMGAALLRQREPRPVSSTINLIDFRPVSDVNVRVIRNHDSN